MKWNSTLYVNKIWQSSEAASLRVVMFSMAMKYEKFESDGKTSYTPMSRHENAFRIIDPLWGETHRSPMALPMTDQ